MKLTRDGERGRESDAAVNEYLEVCAVRWGDVGCVGEDNAAKLGQARGEVTGDGGRDERDCVADVSRGVFSQRERVGDVDCSGEVGAVLPPL